MDEARRDPPVPLEDPVCHTAAPHPAAALAPPQPSSKPQHPSEGRAAAQGDVRDDDAVAALIGPMPPASPPNGIPALPVATTTHRKDSEASPLLQVRRRSPIPASQSYPSWLLALS